MCNYKQFSCQTIDIPTFLRKRRCLTGRSEDQKTSTPSVNVAIYCLYDLFWVLFVCLFVCCFCFVFFCFYVHPVFNRDVVFPVSRVTVSCQLSLFTVFLRNGLWCPHPSMSKCRILKSMQFTLCKISLLQSGYHGNIKFLEQWSVVPSLSYINSEKRLQIRAQSLQRFQRRFLLFSACLNVFFFILNVVQQSQITVWINQQNDWWPLCIKSMNLISTWTCARRSKLVRRRAHIGFLVKISTALLSFLRFVSFS